MLSDLISLMLQKFAITPFSKINGDTIRMVFVQVNPKANMDNVILQIKILLAKRHNVTLASNSFTITTQQDIIKTQESTTSAFRSLLAWVAGVSLIVGGIGIMNIMLVSVTERTREIGIRMAVGARGRDILIQFLIEAVTLSLVGGMVGIALGMISAQIVAATTGWPTITPFAWIGIACVSSAGIGIVSGFYPAWKASRLDPIEALRYE